MEHQGNLALVVGVTGMAGLSLAQALTAQLSWRPMEGLRCRSLARAQLVPSFQSRPLHHLRRSGLCRHTNVATNKAMLLNVVTTLNSSTSSRLTHVTVQTGTKHYIGPISDPVLSPKLLCHEPPFHENMPRLLYPNFYYALEDVVESYAPSLTYSVLRPSIIVGASPRSAYNIPLTLATYAVIYRHVGLAFRYPGTRYTWEHCCDMTDAGVLAQQHVWTAVTPKAKNQAFNCTNGDVFTWKSMWKLLSELFDVEFVPFDKKQEFDLVGLLRDKGDVWEDIVKKYGLQNTKLEEITCYEAIQRKNDAF